MKIIEMREMTEEELQAQVETARKELFDARFKHTLHQLDNTALLNQLKNRIAQLKTVINEKARKKA